MDSMTRKEKWIWGILLALSLFARLAGLGTRAVSHDESLHAIYSWYWSNGLNYQHNPMMHGPLLFHLTGLLFTLLPPSDFVARLIPAVMGTGCVAMMIPYRRWLGGAGALCAGILISLDPGHLFYSRYLRNDIYISLFTLIMVWSVFRYRETERPKFLIWLAVGLGLSFASKEVCFIHGVMLGAGCVLFSVLETLRSRERSWTAWLKHPLLRCAALILFLALPFITGLLTPGGTWSPPSALQTEIEAQAIRIGLILVGISLILGSGFFIYQNRWHTWMASSLLFWLINFSLYTTLFTNLRRGLATGIAGSLGYWWAQHDVQRGNPDPAFYLTLLLLYAPVLLLGAGLALRRTRNTHVGFLLFWAVLHLGIYSWAGERMPWLLIHISLPLCILLGMQLPDLFHRTGWKSRALQALIILGLFQFMANSLRLSGPHAEGPWEPMVYAHSGEHLKLALFLAKDHLEQHPDTSIQVDPAYTWPTAWYFREIPAGYEAVTTPESVGPRRSVILVAPQKRETFQKAGWTSRMEANLTTWPRQRYHRITRKNLRNLVTKPSVRKRFLDYYLTRTQPEWREGEFPGPNRFLLMTREL
jgi:uncharacterized protein (TIGR03663 family)